MGKKSTKSRSPVCNLIGTNQVQWAQDFDRQLWRAGNGKVMGRGNQWITWKRKVEEEIHRSKKAKENFLIVWIHHCLTRPDGDSERVVYSKTILLIWQVCLGAGEIPQSSQAVAKVQLLKLHSSDILLGEIKCSVEASCLFDLTDRL